MEGGMVSEREKGKEEREGENWRRGQKSDCFPLKKMFRTQQVIVNAVWKLHAHKTYYIRTYLYV